MDSSLIEHATRMPLAGRRHARLQAETWLGKMGKGKMHEQPKWMATEVGDGGGTSGGDSMILETAEQGSSQSSFFASSRILPCTHPWHELTKDHHRTNKHSNG